MRERERERYRETEKERDGSDVTIVAPKLAMSLHFPLLKNCTIGDDLKKKPKTKYDQILPSPIVLPIEKMNQINTKNYWK